MAQVLSQDEVDALLSAVNEDGDEEIDNGLDDDFEDDESDQNIQPYDLTNEDRVIRGRMPILEIIYERFIRSFRVSLSNSLRKISTISMISIDQSSVFFFKISTLFKKRSIFKSELIKHFITYKKY